MLPFSKLQIKQFKQVHLETRKKARQAQAFVERQRRQRELEEYETRAAYNNDDIECRLESFERHLIEDSDHEQTVMVLLAEGYPFTLNLEQYFSRMQPNLYNAHTYHNSELNYKDEVAIEGNYQLNQQSNSVVETQHMNDSTNKPINGGESSTIMRMESGQKDSLLIPTMLDVELRDTHSQKKLKKAASSSKNNKCKHGGLRTVRATRQASINNLGNTKSTIRNNGSDSSLGALISIHGPPNGNYQLPTSQPGTFQINLIKKGAGADYKYQYDENTGFFNVRSSQVISASYTPSPDPSKLSMNRPLRQNQQTQDEIISDINKTFDQLKSLFPRGGSKKLYYQHQPSLYHDNFSASSKLLQRRGLGHKSAVAKTHQTTVRGSQVKLREASFQQLGIYSKYFEQTGCSSGALQNSMLTSVIPTKRKDASSSHNSSSLPTRQMLKMKNRNTLMLKNRIMQGKKHQRFAESEQALREEFLIESGAGDRGDTLHPRQLPLDMNMKSNASFGSHQQAQLNVLQLDAQQMVKLSQANYSKKVGSTMYKRQQIYNRLINRQGPIKRLKSAMIRSVFDHGHHMYGDQTSSAQGTRYTIMQREAGFKSSPKYRHLGAGTSNRYRENLQLEQSYSGEIMINRGEQIALPTQALYTPIYDEFGHLAELQTQQYQLFEHGVQQTFTDTNSKNSHSHEKFFGHYTPNYKLLPTAVDDYQNDIVHLKTGNFASGEFQSLEDQYYQKIILMGNALYSADPSSFINTPENEPIEPRMQVYTAMMDIEYNLLPEEGVVDTADDAKTRTMELEGGDNYNNDDMAKSAMTARYEALREKEGVLEFQAERNTKGRASDQSLEISKLKESDGTKHVVYAKIQGNTGKLKKKGQKQNDIMLDSGGNETLHLGSMKHSRKIVSVKDMDETTQSLATLEHKIAINNRFQKTSENVLDEKIGVNSNEAQNQASIAGNSTMQLMRHNDPYHFNRNQVNRHLLQPQHNNLCDSATGNPLQHSSLLSSTGSGGQHHFMQSKLKQADDQKYGIPNASHEAQNDSKVKPVEQPGYQYLCPQYFDPDRNRKKLAYNMGKHKAYPIYGKECQAYQDYEYLVQLQKEIAEDQMSKYMLTNGQKTSLLKIDHHYMNKALVEKIKLYNERFYLQSAQNSQRRLQNSKPWHNSHHLQAQEVKRESVLNPIICAANATYSDFKYGLQEMQRLENSLRVSQGSQVSIINQSAYNVHHSTEEAPYAYYDENSKEYAYSYGSRITVKMSKDFQKLHLLHHMANFAQYSRQVGIRHSEATISAPNMTQVTTSNPALRTGRRERGESEDIAVTYGLDDSQYIKRIQMQHSTPEKVYDLLKQEQLLDNARGGTEKLVRKDESITESNQKNLMHMTSQSHRSLEKQELKQRSKSDDSAEHAKNSHYTNDDLKKYDANKSTEKMENDKGKINPQTLDTESTQLNQQMQKRLQTVEHLTSIGNQDLTIVDVIGVVTSDFVLKKPPQQDKLYMSKSGQASPPVSDALKKPLQRFVNINEYTKFAKIKPSIIYRNGLTNSYESQQKDLSELKQRMKHRNSSDNKLAAILTPPNYELVTFQSVNSTPMASHLLNPLPYQRAASILAKAPDSSYYPTISHNSQKMLIHENIAQQNSGFDGRSRQMAVGVKNSLSGFSSRHIVLIPPPQPPSQYQQLTLSYAKNEAQVRHLRQSSSGGIIVSAAKAEPMGLQGSQKDLKGVLGQQTTFDSIDIEKLTSDKALNRHIHGPDIVRQQQNQYERIKYYAKAGALESQSRVAVKNEKKTMISQQTAHYRSLRNLKSAMGGGRNTDKNGSLVDGSKHARTSDSALCKVSADTHSDQQLRTLNNFGKNANEYSVNASQQNKSGVSQVTLHQYFMSTNAKHGGKRVKDMFDAHQQQTQQPTLHLKYV